jgi:hypothetical protein
VGRRGSARKLSPCKGLLGGDGAHAADTMQATAAARYKGEFRVSLMTAAWWNSATR